MMNTANKRASAIGIGLALRLVLPIPDATIDAADRSQVAYSYAGIQVSNPIIGPVDLVHLEASIRSHVNVIASFHTDVEMVASIRQDVTLAASMRQDVTMDVNFRRHAPLKVER